MQKMESKKIKQKKQQQMKKTLFELPTMLSLAVTLQKMSAFMGLGCLSEEEKNSEERECM